ncbi:Activating signal cointegrator 1 complex subunit 1 [Larimichthys crocea]|uniref:Activating signal cointegrator 1 complex subunit 1 n=1 Tax=Larimichthys crocea TaxID=215358 RepID=A0A6G0HYN6_LARCR|nr:Activating signal cointegrator 1 complex subunit 1 [Larimichthys crocea]
MEGCTEGSITKEEHYEEEEDFSYMGPPESEDFAEDETCGTHFIEQTDKGFRCAVDVPSVLYKYIIGKKGETRKRLEFDTKTSINIPKQGVEGQIVITGSHKAAVSSALTRVELLLESFRKKQPFTHFLSLPLNDPKIQEGFLRFKDEVLKQCSQDHGCQNIIRDLTEGKPLPLEVTGIEYMNDDPAMVDVLYAKVNVKDRSDRLQMIAERLVEHFASAGLMVREWDRVKLHGTVMNTLFRKDSTGEDTGGPGRQTTSEREAFDARNILKKFASTGLSIFSGHR